MIGQSQSGTGKTAAFVLTMLSRIDYDLHKPQVRFITVFDITAHSQFSQCSCQYIAGSLPCPFSRTGPSNHVCRHSYGQIHQRTNRIRNQGKPAEGCDKYHCSNHNWYSWHYDGFNQAESMWRHSFLSFSFNLIVKRFSTLLMSRYSY
jgi:hypothetical protein